MMKEKNLTVNRPTGSTSITNISGGAVGMDHLLMFLYPSTMTMRFPSRQSRRKRKIKKILES